LKDRAIAAAQAIAGDEALKAELVRRHGPEARARVERLAAAIATDEELAASARRVVDGALELLAGTLREIALDEAGTGPNPLPVAFVRARLHKVGPVLILRTPGSGMAVSEGQVFVARTR